MLVRADPSTDSISLLSFPRDMRWRSGARGARRTSTRSRTPPACGPQGSLDTVKALTGIPVNYLITVNFRGFRQIIDRLGGAWIDVDRRYFNDRGGPSGYAKINLRPGYQQLTGRQALDYVRYRHTDSDPLPRRAPAAVREGVQGPGAGELRSVRAAEDRQCDHEQRRGCPGRRQRRSGRHHPFLRAVRLRPAADTSSRTRSRAPRVCRADYGLREHRARGPDVHASRRRVLGGRRPRSRSARSSSSACRLRATRASPSSTETASRARHRPRGSSSASAATRSCFRRTGSRPTRRGTRTSGRRSTSHPTVAGPARRRRASRTSSGSAEVIAPREIPHLSNGAMLTVVVGQTFHGSLAAAPIDRTPKRAPPERRVCRADAARNSSASAARAFRSG